MILIKSLKKQRGSVSAFAYGTFTRTYENLVVDVTPNNWVEYNVTFSTSKAFSAAVTGGNGSHTYSWSTSGAGLSISAGQGTATATVQATQGIVGGSVTCEVDDGISTDSDTSSPISLSANDPP